MVGAFLQDVFSRKLRFQDQFSWYGNWYKNTLFYSVFCCLSELKPMVLRGVFTAEGEKVLSSIIIRDHLQILSFAGFGV